MKESFKPLSWQLLKSILGIYILITVIITASHVFIEYRHIKNSLEKELIQIGEIFKPSLQSAIWELNDEQIASVGKGIQNMPIVYGVDIISQSGGVLYKNKKSGVAQTTSGDFSYTFDVNYEFEGKIVHLANVSLHSNNEVVFERTKVGFLMLLLSAFIKSAALAALFYLAFQRYLKNPLDMLTKQVSGIKDKEYGATAVSVEFKNQNELSLLQTSFNELLKHIHEQEELKTSIISEQNKLLEIEVQKRTKELQKSELRHRIIFEESSSPGIVWKDGFIVTDWNKRAEELFGWGKEEVIGKSFFDFLIPQNIQKAIQDKLAEITKIENMLPHSINQNTTKDGRSITCEWFNSLLPIVEGEAQEVVSLAVDITERLKAEEIMREAKQRAEAATHAKSEFLANMSHEIRTPMNAIIGMTYLVKETNLDSSQRDYISKIENSANSLLGIINDILDFSKIEAGKLELENIEFDLHTVVESVINIVELKAHEKGLEFIVGYDHNTAMSLFGDPLRLGQILINLSTNAVKFTNYGEVGIYIKKVATDRFRFEVKDTGIGLDKQQQERLFKSFSQADNTTTRKYGGTGLGLAISKQLVGLMNGTIWVESEPGVGSSFIFEIELKEIEADKNEIYTVFENKNVLIVDDTPSWQTILTRLLHRYNVTVSSVYSGKEALDTLRRDPKRFDLVLMDWKMPEMDGIEATKLIKEQCKDAVAPTIIMVSSHNGKDVIEKAKEAGIDKFLHKPINPSLLYEALTELFGNSVAKTHNKTEQHSLKTKISSLAGSIILLAEDNLLNQEIVIGMLKNSGIKIEIAQNGIEAVNMFKTNKTKYELILMDIQMPSMDGYQASRIIRKINKNIPIIALTANAMKSDADKAKDAGMNDHISKPIDPQKLFAALLAHISKKCEPSDDTAQDAKPLQNRHPLLTHVDIDKVIPKVIEDIEFYGDIAGMFVDKYDNFKLELDDKEYKNVIHTMKGISATIGATELHKLSVFAEKEPKDETLALLMTELTLVCEELKKNFAKDKKAHTDDKIELSSEEIEALFAELREAIGAKRPKLISPIMEKLDKIALPSGKEKSFQSAKKHIDGYEFEEALTALEG